MALNVAPPLDTDPVSVSWFNFLKELNQSFFSISQAAPDKPWEGMIRFADGTNWNPGSGRGLYQYVSGAWAKL